MKTIKKFDEFMSQRSQINEGFWSKLTGKDKRRKGDIDNLTKQILSSYRSAEDSGDKELMNIFKTEFKKTIDNNFIGSDIIYLIQDDRR